MIDMNAELPRNTKNNWKYVLKLHSLFFYTRRLTHSSFVL
uniref:Uncharacterized protein n=1 Tax=Lepeophtheirus salmonis TaxID=72036 RepID=A0A0K2V9L4_LEPSM